MSRGKRNDFGKTNITPFTTMLLIVTVIIVAIIAFVLAYTFYGTKLSKKSEITNVERVSGLQNNTMLNIINNNEVSDTSASIGKSVNEIQNGVSENNTIVEKRAVNTSTNENKIANNSNQNNNVSKVETSIKNESQENNVEVTKDPEFEKPVDGDIIKDYSSDNLVYSNTLEEWTTHLGIDFAAEKTSVVKASADGTVKSIKNDPRYGLTIILEHSNGFSSMYSSLLSTEFVAVGENVTKGQTIATVGNTATFEIADQTHLHFEILKDGVNVDPNLYLK